MSAWQGDLSDLGRIADSLARLSEVPSRAARSAAVGIAEAIDQQFANGVDPYGVPWAPLKESTIERKGSSDILIESSRMRDTVKVVPMQGAGISVTFEAEYAGFAQTGFVVGKTKVPPRKVIPDGPIPEAWEHALDDSFDEAFGAAR
jgi:Phage virion morphogenesis family